MKEIKFYKLPNGEEPVKDYIDSLARKNDKNSRVQLSKIIQYLDILSEHGFNAGMPFIRHVNGDLWELRPLDNRIIFASWKRNSFVLLHSFKKRTQKTPKKEIETANYRFQLLR